MPEDYAAVEYRIQEALDALRKQQKPNLAKIAREFAVPDQRLRARWKGQSSKTERAGANRVLSEEQEIALCHYLDRLDKVGAAARRPMVTQCANTLLRQNHNNPTTAPPVVGRN